jgi:hypothetical protein
VRVGGKLGVVGGEGLWTTRARDVSNSATAGGIGTRCEDFRRLRGEVTGLCWEVTGLCREVTAAGGWNSSSKDPQDGTNGTQANDGGLRSAGFGIFGRVGVRRVGEGLVSERLVGKRLSGDGEQNWGNVPLLTSVSNSDGTSLKQGA